MDQKIQPWEEPLDESYWQALLREEPQSALPECGDTDTKEGFSVPPQEGASEGTVNPHSEASSEETWDRERECWEEMRRCFEAGEILELEVIGYNRGGVLTDCQSLRGFVPASHLVEFKHSSSEEERSNQLKGLVGRKLRFKIIELDPDRNRLILSQRAAESGPNDPLAILDQLRPGEVREGRVTNLCPFGAFVDLGGIEGLIHISELSWGRVSSPHEVLSIGDTIQVYVLNVDRERHRVGLSLKRLQPDPWDSVEERYQVGQLVQGRVTNVVDFGAFVRIEEGLEGLIHVSELAEGNFLHPRNVVREGEMVTVRILNVDGKNHRLGLSLRQV